MTGDNTRDGESAENQSDGQGLVAYLESMGAKTEAQSARDGAFSYSGEWHAFSIGFAVGTAEVMASKRLTRFVYGIIGIKHTGDAERIQTTKVFREARREGWYALGGVFVGMLWGLTAQAIGLYLTAEVAFQSGQLHETVLGQVPSAVLGALSVLVSALASATRALVP